ncbi:oligopeptide transport system ATP-binding protein [Allostreptomyces psammosilenae]|uniref:Oligopeptide transport system ATP-binding protein n=1 Tax=Allostreptomyces psammosilenae TaxID=1892865 RepID=A0A852ZVH4_9ACTN|nr:oligopeptide transport system ATP-binding protein [Allostreptomyces psammosilenae]
MNQPTPAPTPAEAPSTAPKAPAATGSGEPLLDVDDLHVEFHDRLTGTVVHAVNGLSYRLHAGETLAILGESGSGKSVAAQAVMGILDSPPARVTRGAIRFRGTDLLTLPDREHRRLRGDSIAMVFQDALSALNPVHRVGDQIAEMFEVHRGMSRKQARARAVELMDRVRIPSARARAGHYPHEFSGGMRQRVMIAMALALEPDVLIADEPTTALDVTVQAQIMRLLADLQREMRMGLVLITHDLGVVARVADNALVMYAGSVVERAPVRDLYHRPAHPYTRGLLASVPRLDRGAAPLRPIQGSPPNPAALPDGCAFAPRCPLARDLCRHTRPVLAPPRPGPAAPAAPSRTPGTPGAPATAGSPTGRQAACHFAEETAP